MVEEILIELIKRIEAIEQKLADPKFNEPTNNCYEIMRKLHEDSNLIIDRWFWAVTNSVAADEILRNEIIECKKKLGLKVMSTDEYQKRMKLAIKNAKKLIIKALKEGVI